MSLRKLNGSSPKETSFLKRPVVRWESYTVNCSGCFIFNMSTIIIAQSSNISLHVEALLRICKIDLRHPREDEPGPPHAWGYHSGCSSSPEKVTRSGSPKIVASYNLWSSCSTADLSCIHCKIKTDTACQFLTVVAYSLGNRVWARWCKGLSAWHHVSTRMLLILRLLFWDWIQRRYKLQRGFRNLAWQRKWLKLRVESVGGLCVWRISHTMPPPAKISTQV